MAPILTSNRSTNSTSVAAAAIAVAAALALPALADLSPEWITRIPVGTSLLAGLTDMVVAPNGVTYVTGSTGSSSNIDILTAAIAPDGAVLWSHTYNGTANWHDQSRGIALGPDNTLYVCGNTPGSGFYANVLLLKFNASTGALLNTVQFSNGPGLSEYAGSVVTDSAGNVYLGGGTVGDGTDALILKFNSAGALQWQRVWDGPAFAPYSLDSAGQLAIGPDGNLVALIHGVMASNHPDYVVIKYNPSTGATIWESNWGTNGEESPRQMILDTTGDIFVTGTALNAFGTIRLRSSDGAVLWQVLDTLGFNNSVAGLALDGLGGVYITGSVDPDIDQSNSNDNFYSVGRDAANGLLRWTHSYGANCRNCFDAPSAVIADSAGHVFITGYTVSAPYSGDMILFQLDAQTGLEQNRGVVTGNLPEELVFSRMMRLDVDENLLLGADFYNANTGAYDLSLIKYASLSGGGINLTADSACPGGGAITVSWTGATAGGQVGLVYANNTGNFSIPNGPCAGTQLGLGSSGVQLVFQGVAGANGSRTINGTAPGGACGRFLQLVDISTCDTSNVATIN